MDLYYKNRLPAVKEKVPFCGHKCLFFIATKTLHVVRVRTAQKGHRWGVLGIGGKGLVRVLQFAVAGAGQCIIYGIL